METVQRNLAANIRRLRTTRGLSQQRMSELSSIPRPTWASLESGTANPTITVLSKAAVALQVSVEELIGVPRAEVRHFRADEIREDRRRSVRLRPLVPEALSGLEISRMNFDPGGRMAGVPHTPGTREYLTCQQGSVELVVAGSRWTLARDETLVFRGDQPHSYHNPDQRRRAVAISVVCFANR